jgi:hypothetical protein
VCNLAGWLFGWFGGWVGGWVGGWGGGVVVLWMDDEKVACGWWVGSG